MTNKYDPEWLNEICSQVDLLEYASQSHEFKRKGYDSYAAKCELHSDDDPSLFITPSKNLWYCHGCKRGGNIINWMMVYEGLTFRQSVYKIADMCGKTVPIINPSSSLAAMKDIRRRCEADKKEVTERKILSPSFYDNKFKMVAGEPREWLDEGISEEVLRRFNIRIDDHSNRIVYPVYDNDDNLIGVKGRTRFKNYKILGISKYMNYFPLGCIDYFQGMHENRKNILDKDEIIIFEGIKSVMLMATWGYNNAVSAETSRVSDGQVNNLLRLGVSNAVIAFDNDVSNGQLLSISNKLKRFMNVYIISDINHLLREKDAPVDCGKEVWEKLYESKKRIV